MPLHRAKAKRAQIERELSKCPDFQLYLITRSLEDRTRMERVLMLNPNFRLWRALTSSIESALSLSGRRNEGKFTRTSANASAKASRAASQFENGDSGKPVPGVA